jgi:murein DD-endopeptidase MepM/ murein hydrolase activator NlpD
MSKTAGSTTQVRHALADVLRKHQRVFHPVVPFDPAEDKLYPFDFTDENRKLSPEHIADTEQFSDYIRVTISGAGARYGIGGYGEHRTLYSRSKHFDHAIPVAGSEARRTAIGARAGEEEPRRLHLGVDIWGPAGTKVMAPLDGIVHSFAFNNNDSDYGATLILTHNLEGVGFHTLYGHLSLNSLKNLHEGKHVGKGQVIAEFGMRFENGNWPPHLHFQLIEDMEGWKGDYPGVCRFSEREQWLRNCPDADLVLQMVKYASLP